MAITAGDYGIGYTAAGDALQASDVITVDGNSVTLDGAYLTPSAFIADCNAGVTQTGELRGYVYYSDAVQGTTYTGVTTTSTHNPSTYVWELRGMIGSIVGGDQVIIDANNGGSCFNLGTVSGKKHLRNFRCVNGTLYCIIGDQNDQRFQELHISDSTWGFLARGANTVICGCVCEAGSSAVGGSIYGSIFISTSSGSLVTLERVAAIDGCTFCAPNGAALDSTWMGAPIRNSILYGKQVFDSTVFGWGADTRVCGKNNCYYSTDNPGGIRTGVEFSDYWQGYDFSANGNISSNPLFVNGSGSLNVYTDLQLQSGSPCRASNMSAVANNFISGQLDTPIDMGAIQYYAAPTYAAASDVRSGIDRGDGTTGTLTLPAEGKVANGIQFGGGGTEYTGNRTDAAVNTVLTGNSYGESGTEFSGNWTAATASKYQLGETYGIGGTSETGTYDPSVTPDGQPSITSATSGNGQVTIAITAADESDVIYARYRLTGGGNWAAESETFKRTGSGTITVTGLTNNLKDGYEFSAYAKNLTVTSDWAEPVQGWATNDDFLAAREATRQRIRDDAAYAQLKIAQKLGVLVTFSNPGASDVTLYALVDSPSTKNVNVRGNAVRYSEVVFSIPRQTSFPPAAIHPSATITLNSKSYQVEQVEYEAEDISQAESVRLICGVISEQDCY